jgi:hypothetical protein
LGERELAMKCEIDGIAYDYIPVDWRGEPAFMADGGPNPDFDWRWFRGRRKK